MSSSLETVVDKVCPPTNLAGVLWKVSAACQCAASTIHAVCCQFWPWNGPGFNSGRKGSPAKIGALYFYSSFECVHM